MGRDFEEEFKDLLVDFDDCNNDSTDDDVHYILGKFKFEGKYIDYDLDGARQLLEKSYSNGLIKAGLYLCEFVYPKYPSSLNYGEKRMKMLNAITKNSNINASNYAKYLLGNCGETTF